jgi:hypothetical protein
MGSNASGWVMNFYNDDVNKYFYLGAPAIKIFEIAKEYWIAV